MPNLRELAVADMKQYNIADWGLKIELVDPDGTRYDTDDETGNELKAVQVLYDYRKLDPNTGEEITINEPIIVVARSSLARIPIAGEKWQVKFPNDPSTTDALETDYFIDPTRAPEGGRSLGFIRLYPTKKVQS